MHKGATRTQALRPKKLLDLVIKAINKNIDLDEVIIRRLISALYFALFNYWSAKAYESGERGAGELKDSFKYSYFHGTIRERGWDPYIKLFNESRVAVDHYTLNPTIATIYNGYKVYIKIDRNLLNKVLKASIELLNLLDSI